ncbi:bifunctional hydroxymethylpyrimidine kinase/phosphomethylpyrimidine kinase [uncultured Limosilactobacillus sp.]|uniref:bifunctional hydroxymethylpyrimidine kinase/phosphomethylpyrimidine kinase n=1 Tax=uncultured Limosilactobacillus sp. TaxID=2837629 RepID=UPI0025FEC8E4|nr:bifunctional hydroxymethylpyrimidine kinase/phosphomethylpyrimidine kinase [uncultured Limosilactobacillus sp.]
MKQVATLAGLDSNGSAGLAADLHAFFADGVYGHGILTAAVAENATRITAAQTMPVDFVEAELTALRDFPIAAVKTGMMANGEIVKAVVDRCPGGVPLVVDPVIITKQGDHLLDQAALTVFCQQLLPKATVITPNFLEAQVLVDHQLSTPEDLLTAAYQIQQIGAANVVIKGKHPTGDQEPVISSLVLLADGQSFWINNEFVKAKKANGAGDTFSAIIAAELAKGQPVLTAIEQANDFVVAAIKKPLGIGQHFGPLNHWAGQSWRQCDD